MAIIEGTGIVAAGKEARKKAVQVSKQSKTAGGKGTLQFYKENFMNQIDAGGGVENATEADQKRYRQYEKDLQKPKQNIFSEIFKFSKAPEKQNFFSPGGNEVAKVASSDLSNLKVGSDIDSSDTSTFGTSFTDQASANIADASVYKEKEDNIYRPTDNIYDSLKGIKFPKIEKDTGYGASLEKGIDNLDRFDKRYYRVNEATKEYGVPMSEEEKRVTTAYKLTNPEQSFKDKYKFSDTNYAKIQSDYDKYKPQRERREFRKGVEDNLSDFRKDYMKDFRDADYAIKMTQYNPDGTEKNINKYNASLDQQLDNLKILRRAEEPNLTLSRFGKIVPSEENRKFEQKIDSEEQERIKLSKAKAKSDYEDSQKNILQKVGDFIGKVTRPPGAEASENPLSRTVPSGSFNISQEGKDQAAINRGIKAAEATGIPTGVAAQGGVTTQAARDAGVKARQEAADKRAKNMADAQGIASRNPNVSIVGGKAVATNDSGKARAQAAAVNRKIQGKTVSQVKAENKKSMQDAARKRNEAFKKSKAQKKKSGGGFGKSTSTTKKSAPKKSAPKKSTAKKSSPSSQASNKRAQASKKRQAARKKASTAKKSKKSTSKSSKSKSTKSKSTKTAGSKNRRGSGARGNRGRRGGRR